MGSPSLTTQRVGRRSVKAGGERAAGLTLDAGLTGAVAQIGRNISALVYINTICFNIHEYSSHLYDTISSGNN